MKRIVLLLSLILLTALNLFATPIPGPTPVYTAGPLEITPGVPKFDNIAGFRYVPDSIPSDPFYVYIHIPQALLDAGIFFSTNNAGGCGSSWNQGPASITLSATDFACGTPQVMDYYIIYQGTPIAPGVYTWQMYIAPDLTATPAPWGDVVELFAGVTATPTPTPVTTPYPEPTIVATWNYFRPDVSSAVWPTPVTGKPSDIIDLKYRMSFDTTAFPFRFIFNVAQNFVEACASHVPVITQPINVSNIINATGGSVAANPRTVTFTASSGWPLGYNFVEIPFSHWTSSGYPAGEYFNTLLLTDLSGTPIESPVVLPILIYTATVTQTRTPTPTITSTSTITPTITPGWELSQSAYPSTINNGQTLTMRLSFTATGNWSALEIRDQFAGLSSAFFTYHASTPTPSAVFPNGKRWLYGSNPSGYSGIIDVLLSGWKANTTDTYVTNRVSIYDGATLRGSLDLQVPFNTFTPTRTTTVSPTRTNTRTITPTSTATPTRTSTNTPTITKTSTPGATDTATPTITNTFTISATWTDTSTPQDTKTVTPTITQTSTRTSTRTVTATITRTATRTRTPTITKTITRTATPTRTTTITKTITPTSTVTGTITETNTPADTRTVTPTITVTNTFTFTRTVTPTITRTSTFTKTATITKTITKTATQTRTPSITRTVTPTAADTGTITETVTKTSTKTITQTVTQTATATVTKTRTATPTLTVTETITPTFTVTLTNTPRESRTPTLTITGTPPTSTSTQTITPTVTQTTTPTSTSTVTETHTVSPTATITPTINLTPHYYYSSLDTLVPPETITLTSTTGTSIIITNYDVPSDPLVQLRSGPIEAYEATINTATGYATIKVVDASGNTVDCSTTPCQVDLVIIRHNTSFPWW